MAAFGTNRFIDNNENDDMTTGTNTINAITSRGVNEARGSLILAVARVRSKQNIIEKKNTKKFAPPKAHHDIPSSPATATTSRRRATKHVPRVSPYSPGSIDPGFVQIDLVQLSQSVKTTNVTHTHTD